MCPRISLTVGTSIHQKLTERQEAEGLSLSQTASQLLTEALTRAELGSTDSQSRDLTDDELAAYIGSSTHLERGVRKLGEHGKNTRIFAQFLVAKTAAASNRSDAIISLIKELRPSPIVSESILESARYLEPKNIVISLMLIDVLMDRERYARARQIAKMFSQPELSSGYVTYLAIECVFATTPEEREKLLDLYRQVLEQMEEKGMTKQLHRSVTTWRKAKSYLHR